MSASVGYLLGTKTADEAVTKVEELGPEALARAIVNDTLNTLISNRDGGGIFDGAAGIMHIPYAGWYWRSVDFFAPHGVTIADEGGGRTVICENNKWGYPQRSLTDDERAEFLRLVWKAHKKSRAGGNLAEIHAALDKALDKAGAYILSLDVHEEVEA